MIPFRGFFGPIRPKSVPPVLYHGFHPADKTSILSNGLLTGQKKTEVASKGNKVYLTTDLDIGFKWSFESVRNKSLAWNMKVPKFIKLCVAEIDTSILDVENLFYDSFYPKYQGKEAWRKHYEYGGDIPPEAIKEFHDGELDMSVFKDIKIADDQAS